VTDGRAKPTPQDIPPQAAASGQVGPAPRVSIILPVLNEGRYIEQCLRSVVEQDYPAALREVLVLDGGSTDDTREKVRAFAAAHPGFSLLDNPGRTQVKAFNLGVRRSCGGIIIRLDAHARYDPSYVRKCVETLDATGAANAGGVWQIEAGGPSLMARSVAILNRERFGIGGARFRVGGTAGPTDTVPFGAFRRDAFDKVGLMNERLVRGEDNEFNSRLRKAGLTVYFNPEIRCIYFARAGLAGFLKQMYGNGLYHILTLMVNRGGCSLRHFVPFGFVMFLMTFASGGLFWRPIWLVGGIILALYLLADLAASISAAAREGWAQLAVLPWLFPLVHISYGVGTLVGIFQFAVPAIFGRRDRTAAQGSHHPADGSSGESREDKR